MLTDEFSEFAFELRNIELKKLNIYVINVERNRMLYQFAGKDFMLSRGQEFIGLRTKKNPGLILACTSSAPKVGS